MAELELLKRKRKSAEELLSIVKAMKALSRVSLHQYEGAVASLASYDYTVELGLQIALSEGMVSPHGSSRPAAGLSGLVQLGEGAPKRPSRLRWGMILVGSDQGMCGPFNEQIARFGLERCAALAEEGQGQSWRLMAIGQRLLPHLEELLELEATRHTPQGLIAIDPCDIALPGVLARLTDAVYALLGDIETWRKQHQLDKIVLLYHWPTSSVSHELREVVFWPLDLEALITIQSRPWKGRSLPTYRLDREVLLAALFRQHMMSALLRAIAGSLACENASRFAAMQAAQRKIEDRLQALSTAFHQERQNAITTELLDIVAGFEALGGASR